MLRIATRTIALFAISLVVFGLPIMASDDGALNFEERVRYQRLIEDVYWQNRIWPEENPGLKPPLDEVMPDEVIRERVQAYLEKSAALEKFWSRPLSGEQLQAEMGRMVSQTKNSEMLTELFAALDDDPFLIAECLARPVLVDRLTRNWYARDNRFHGTLKEQAESALAVYSGDVATMSALGGQYQEMEFRLVTEEPQTTDLGMEPAEHSAIGLNVEEWLEQIERIATLFGIEQNPNNVSTQSDLLDRIPLGSLSRLVDENDRFIVTSVLLIEQDLLKIASVTWNKRPFDAWWAEEGRIAVQSTAGDNPVSSPDDGYKIRWRINEGCSDDTWTELWYLPASRSGHAAVWTGTEMIVWGGSGRGVPISGGRYDPATDSWTATSIGDGVPSERTRYTVVWTGREMIIWGGFHRYTPYFNTGGRYDPVTNSWTATSIGENTPSGRQMHSAVWTGTEMIIWGGYANIDGENLYLNTGGKYDPVTNSWTTTSTGDGVPAGRRMHKAVWTSTEMIIWGGYGPIDGIYLFRYWNTGGKYNPVTNSWTAISIGDGVPSGRVGHTMVWTGSEVVVWGGYNGSRMNTGGRYNPAIDHWTATTTGNGVPSERTTHTAVWTGSEMIVWGGYSYDYENRESLYLNTGGRYDPEIDSWKATSTETSVPLGRVGHTAVWTGSEMIVWGGGDNVSGGTNTGGRYDPVSDSWIPTYAAESVPAARFNHTTVWTGAEAIVWGGRGSYGSFDDWYLNTGGRYDPATDNWTATSIVGAVPQERENHSAVWTGTEMIVWGGYRKEHWPPSTSYKNTGGRYNPMTDVWVTTSIGDGVPTGRTGHTGVWTGSEVIIWGGRKSKYFFLNTGGRYNPATDSWAEASIGDNVPSERQKHTAVWTGSEMIVWGGHPYDREGLNTGARYNPATDGWTETSIGANVPDERQGHTAVWTGSEMIIWGGLSGPHYLGDSYRNTGGRYDPATNSWSATSVGNSVPPGRVDHAAIWTGTEMIVWGGTYSEDYYSNYYRNSGGRYSPATNGWTATSIEDGLPSERADHTAVWTGTHMIVWGGRNSSADFFSGGLYCACEGVRERERYELHDDPDDGSEAVRGD